MGEYLNKHIHGNGALLLEALKLHLTKLAEQNVKYVEIMLCSFLSLDEELLYKMLEQYQQAAEENTDILVGYLWAVGRSSDKAVFFTKIEKCRTVYKEGFISGIAIAGNEHACTIREHSKLFDSLADEEIPVEIHAGEWAGLIIWDALQYGHPRRLGHALSLFDDPGQFECSMNSEFAVINSVRECSEAFMETVYSNSHAAAFT